MSFGRGHFILRNEQVAVSTRTEAVLKCGCRIKTMNHDPKNHTWTLVLDYSDCREHHHDEHCQP